MPRHELQLTLSDCAFPQPLCPQARVLRIDLRKPSGGYKFGLDQIVEQLARCGLRPSNTGMDLLILAVAVQIADTRISRSRNAEDSWTREIDLTVPVTDPVCWNSTAPLIERMLRFLSGDIWKLRFMKRPVMAEKAVELAIGSPPDLVTLFSGGMDSYLGAVELLHAGRNPLFVSHYWDLGTSSQAECADHLETEFGNFHARHLRIRIGAQKRDVLSNHPPENENSQRARSFVFFALAAAAASSLAGPVEVTVPENGLISLNVPLDVHRIGAYSTRTTHPFYMARWNEVLAALRISASLKNPFQCLTKGEMIVQSPRLDFVRRTVASTISCSSVAKARWGGSAPGHCGHCYPCLIRRAAELKGLGHEVTKYISLPHLAAQVDRSKAVGEHIWSIRFIAERLAARPLDCRSLVNKTGPFSDYTVSERDSFAEVFRRGIIEVDNATKVVRFT
jgi:7-cyano-7-deazaguanine synthase in queuosine biosynthesis